MTNTMIKVLVVEDHQLMIDGLKLLLDDAEDIQLVGQARNGRQAINLLNNLDIDVAVIDISMPEMDGVELAKYIAKHHPNIKVLVLTMHKKERHVTSMAAAGIAGYILKENGEKEFVSAIRSIIKDGYYYDKEVAKLIMDRIHAMHRGGGLSNAAQLTKRELEVLVLVGKGLTSKEIAESLFIETSTVETHKNNLKEKLNLRDSKALMKYAINKGYTDD